MATQEQIDHYDDLLATWAAAATQLATAEKNEQTAADNCAAYAKLHNVGLSSFDEGYTGNLPPLSEQKTRK